MYGFLASLRVLAFFLLQYSNDDNVGHGIRGSLAGNVVVISCETGSGAVELYDRAEMAAGPAEINPYFALGDSLEEDFTALLLDLR
jgi:hypothetical protein